MFDNEKMTEEAQILFSQKGNIQARSKAVRDRIPEIIENSGKERKVITLSDDEFLIEIENKLLEEVNEYLENKSESELAVILEVIYTIAELRGLK